MSVYHYYYYLQSLLDLSDDNELNTLVSLACRPAFDYH